MSLCVYQNREKLFQVVPINLLIRCLKKSLLRHNFTNFFMLLTAENISFKYVFETVAENQQSIRGHTFM